MPRNSNDGGKTPIDVIIVRMQRLEIKCSKNGNIKKGNPNGLGVPY